MKVFLYSLLFCLLNLSQQNMHGQVWLNVSSGIDCYSPSYVKRIFLNDSGTRMFIAGRFNLDGNCNPMRATLSYDGEVINQLAVPLTGSEASIAFEYQSNIYCSGELVPQSTLSALALNYVNEFGIWDTVPAGIYGRITDYQQRNGIAFLSGAFTECGGQPCSLVCTFDGVTVAPLYLGVPNEAWAFDLEFFQDTLFVAGRYSANNELTWEGYSRCCKLVDGQLDRVATGFYNGGAANALEIFDDKLFIGGWLKALGDVADHSIYYYQNGQLFTLPEEPGFQINVMKAYQGGLYVVGDFTQFGSTPCNNVARWDGQSWTCLSDEVLYMQNGNPCQLECINDIEIWNDTLYIGGAFHTIGNSELKRIAKLNLNLSEAFPVKVKEYEVPDFSMFPNPSSLGFSLSCPALHLGEKVDWKLIDVAGKSAISGTSVYSNSLSIDTYGLASGVYYLQLQCNEWSATKAVVVE